MRSLYTASWACLSVLAAAILVGDSAMCAGSSAPEGNAFALVRIPDPRAGNNPRVPMETVNLPAPGASVYDNRLGTTQTRATARLGLRHEYARHDPFNRDGSRVLLNDITNGAWLVYRTGKPPYDREGGLVRDLEVEEPRWDASDPRIVWATQEFSILRIDVESGQKEIVKDFRKDAVLGPILKGEPDLYHITMKSEGEASLDRRYWAFIVQGAKVDYRARYLFVWDRSEDRVVGLQKLAESESRIDWVGMSPKGAWVLIGADSDNGGKFAGFVMADRALKQVFPLHYSTGHADVGIDARGNDVVVMQNAQTDFIDLIPLEPSVKPIPPGGTYEGTGHIPLVRLFYASDSPTGFNSGVHVSCNFAGWCVVSTHIEPGVAEKNWLDRSIVLVHLDPSDPRAFYLAKVHGTCSAYWEETHASISADGSRVVWATNWNENIGQEKVWMMEMPMPRDWYRTALTVP